MPEHSAIGRPPGLTRAVWSSVLERDLDLLLLDLLHTSPAFRRWLLETVAPEVEDVDADGSFLGAWHSVTTPNGESDLEAEWLRADGTRLAVLIEDKLAADFQPEQGIRYQERADGYQTSGRASSTRLVLVAPAGYPARRPAEAAPFEQHLSLEAVLAWCEDGPSASGAPTSPHSFATRSHESADRCGETPGHWPASTRRPRWAGSHSSPRCTSS